MMPRHPVFFALLLAFGAAHAAPADTPASYAARWPLQLPAGASVVRLPLPAEVLTQVQTFDLRDLRVFNASGQPVPLALDRLGPGASAAAAPAPIGLPVLPILAEPQAASRGNMTLRIEDGSAGRTVRLDMPAANSAASAPGAQTSTLAGALVDTREQKTALQAIELDADWPAARPFTFRLDTSADLRQWQPLGEVTAYRGADGAAIAPAHLDTGGTSLQARYLRITWDDAAPGAVQLRQVRLLPAPAGPAAPERVAVPLTLPDAGQARDPRVLEWRLPFAAPVAALNIRTGEPATLIPVRVLARQQREQPWTPLARHVVFSLTQNGQTQRSPALELGQAAWREWRIEADPSSPGFAAPPQITALLPPVQLVFVASGSPPFTLAAGRADAADARLPLASLLPGYEPGAQAKLPAATLAAALETPAAVPTTVPGSQRDARKWLLWAVLLAGVLILGGMAWALLRQLKTPASGTD